MRKNYYLTIPFTRMYCTLCHDIQLARTCSLCQIQDKSSYTHSLCIGCTGLAPLLLHDHHHTLATKTLGRNLLEVGMALPFLQIQLYPHTSPSYLLKEVYTQRVMCLCLPPNFQWDSVHEDLVHKDSVHDYRNKMLRVIKGPLTEG